MQPTKVAFPRGAARAEAYMSTLQRAGLTALLALALTREAGAMGFGNSAPTVGAVSFSPTPVPALAEADVTCAATDDAGVAKFTFTVSAGALAGGATTQVVTLAAPLASATATVRWSTPAAGDHTVTCAATDAGGTFGGALTTSRTVTASVQAIADPPGVDALAADRDEVEPGGAVHLVATAHGDGIGYAWSASGGTLQANGPTATWTAPATAGAFTVGVTVTDAAGRSASASTGIAVVWARQGPPFSGAAPGSVFLPAGVAVDPAGTTWVTNPRRAELVAFSGAGAVLRRVEVGGWPSAVAVGPDRSLYVGDLASGGVRVLSQTGAPLRVLGAGTLRKPTAVAVHPGTGQVFVGDRALAAVVVLDASGQAVRAIPLAGAAPAGLALDPAHDRLYVSDARSGRLLVFTLSGVALGAFGTYEAPITRAGGVALGPDGNLYVVDTYQAHVVVLSPAGVPVAFLGAAAGTAGALDVPLAIAADPRGLVRVTSTQTGRVESFALAGFQPSSCPGDLDCDGLPDAWELAHGLDPSNPFDADADPDGDGLTSAAEYARGTDPRDADTDDDGWSDGAEVAAGDDPLDARDHAPLLVADAARSSDPGLVRLEAHLEARGTCAVDWTQIAGPTVALRDATTLSPSFVGRTPGDYRFEGVAVCSRGTSAPAVLEADVRAVPPRADAGRPAVVHLGDAISLDGGFSWDANGDLLALSWDQTLGAPLAGAAPGTGLGVRPTRRGLLSFQLTAVDPGGLAATAEVPVLVVDSGLVPPTAVVASPVLAEVGTEVHLDATESVGGGGLTGFGWRQVAGPAVTLADAATASPRFVPAAPGLHAFEVSALAGDLRSPPARVDVHVARSGVPLPVAAASAPAAVAAGEPIILDGSASTPAGALVHAWRQVSGPAAGLTEADRPVATAVPFAPGVLVFELVVKDGEAASLPARVTVTAGEPGVEFPRAVASAPGAAREGDVVRLDGSGSQIPSGGAARWRWTQVWGPWVALADAAAPVTTFRPPAPGLYVFELEADDGTLRSAPATVSILVSSRSSGGGAR